MNKIIIIVLLTINLPAWALPTAQTEPGTGMFSYGYQMVTIGDEEGKAHNFILDYGVNESVGAGITFGSHHATSSDGRSSISMGDIYFKYQVLKGFETSPSVAIFGGYRYFSGSKYYTSGDKAGTTDHTSPSGFELGLLGDLPFSEKITGHARIGFAFFKGGTLNDIEFGLGGKLSSNMSLELGFKSFSAGGSTSGGATVGLKFDFYREEYYW